MRILIAGAGIGGLALAQALRRTGMDVSVYERDPSPRTRNQGYRIHIDPNGNAALRACLPPPVLDLARDTSGAQGDLVAFYTQELEQISAQVFPDVPSSDITNVDRETFRLALLSGLNITYGRTVTGYELTPAGRVRVFYEQRDPDPAPSAAEPVVGRGSREGGLRDPSEAGAAASGGSREGGLRGPSSAAAAVGGGVEEVDLLVGADGVGSAVRRQLVPSAALRDLGLRCLYGRMPLDGAALPPDFDRGFCWVSGTNGYGAGFAPVRFRTVTQTPDYLMTTLVAPASVLGSLALPSPSLWQICMDATATWHPAVRRLFEQADRTSFFPITLRAGTRVEPWTPGPVTLLGDAIHTMPPAGGVGANTALQDAALLAAELLSGKPLREAVAAYESVMLPRGFDTVDNSVRMIGQMVPQPSGRPS
ncbi:monooxygenase [Paractinoplanes deccanensis]|uniref:Monooxygenase n=1 Tax=Paractinoplanes deccanensis TaxID=113561 RepID=A0ABQ3YA80_9ACTN|nr:FAD-dependent monooxygenase [Actinoplanes deccanensis]GID76740.1 monooxygenase [Actinoplanes deccanensis]